jgi:hypothetical protein
MAKQTCYQTPASCDITNAKSKGLRVYRPVLLWVAQLPLSDGHAEAGALGVRVIHLRLEHLQAANHTSVGGYAPVTCFTSA